MEDQFLDMYMEDRLSGGDGFGSSANSFMSDEEYIEDEPFWDDDEEMF